MMADVQIPILPEEAILAVINNITSVPFTANDLKTPTFEKLYTVYSGFLCSLLNVSNEQITQVPLHVMEMMSPELHTAEATGNLLFFKALEYLFNVCCINNFTMSDVTNPTRKRTRKLLSAIVNYTQFNGQYSPIRNDILTKLETLQKDQEVLLSRRDQLKERIANLKAQRLEKQRAVHEMNLSALKANQQEIQAIKEQSQENNNALEGEVEELQNVLTLARASKLILQGEEARDEHLLRGQNLAIKEKLFTQYGSITPSVLKLVQGVNQDVEKFRVLTDEMENLQDRKIEQSKVLRDVTSDVQNSLRLLQSKGDKKQRCETLFEKKMERHQYNEKQLEIKQGVILKDIENKQKQLLSVRQEMKERTEADLLAQQEHKQVIKTMEDHQVKLQDKLSSYQDYVSIECNKLTSKLQQL